MDNMTKNNENSIQTQSFAQHVLDGLSSSPKKLSSKYFYDAAGDKIFEQIMELPEYYLTRAEHDIISNASYSDRLKNIKKELHVVELGAGNGVKTSILLDRLVQAGMQVVYQPIDISAHALELNMVNVAATVSSLDIRPLQGEYFEVLDRLQDGDDHVKLVLFLGSNLGNFSHDQSAAFLQKLSDRLNSGDYLFLGLDLKKNPSTILKAYNDVEGVTASFNMNLLHRMNKELGADFKVEQWMHYPVYNPESGTTKSYLVSTKAQEVYFSALDTTISFEAWETIHTEVSQKYTEQVLRELLKNSSLEIVEKYQHSDVGYADFLIQKK